jgi:hypothetical protein
MEDRKAKGSGNKKRTRAPLIAGLVAVMLLGLFFAVYSLLPSREGGPAAPEAPAPEENLPPSGFSRLDITAVSYGEGQVRIEGATNLPDGARLVVDFDVTTPESESDTAVSGHTTVEKGRFSVTVTPPGTPAFSRGPYTVTVLFSPRTQPENVLAMVGRNGENLTGDRAHETFGFRVLEAKEQVDISLTPGAVWRRGESRV